MATEQIIWRQPMIIMRHSQIYGAKPLVVKGVSCRTDSGRWRDYRALALVRLAVIFDPGNGAYLCRYLNRPSPLIFQNVEPGIVVRYISQPLL